MKKIFLLLAFTGIVGAASATSLSALTNETVITLGGDDKKKEEKKKCEKKSCCKSKQTAQAGNGCAGSKTAEAAAVVKPTEATAETKEVKTDTAAPSVK